VERIFLSLKKEEVWPSEYENFQQALAAVEHWIDDYNRERPRQAPKNRIPLEVCREALELNPIRSLKCQRQEGSLRHAHTFPTTDLVWQWVGDQRSSESTRSRQHFHTRFANKASRVTAAYHRKCRRSLRRDPV
jgi:hypothetical protein